MLIYKRIEQFFIPIMHCSSAASQLCALSQLAQFSSSRLQRNAAHKPKSTSFSFTSRNCVESRSNPNRGLRGPGPPRSEVLSPAPKPKKHCICESIGKRSETPFTLFSIHQAPVCTQLRYRTVSTLSKRFCCLPSPNASWLPVLSVD